MGRFRHLIMGTVSSLVGYGANLTDANFTNADLFGADLVEANLTGATLTGVTSGSVQGQFTVTLSASWNIRDGYLPGPGANLAGADLAGSGTLGADLMVPV
jgi:uncharacterized protein YjbI with pentapeptide repeats